MSKFTKTNFLHVFARNVPLILLFISVLNEFDFNYLEIKYFSFNFPFILIFYSSLKKSNYIGYGYIFLAGLINDAVVGLPIGISSLTYLLICGFAAYLRNITLRPSLFKDWLFFLFTILVVNSLIYIILVLFFSVNINYYSSMINLAFTFFLYLFFAQIFKFYNDLLSQGRYYD